MFSYRSLGMKFGIHTSFSTHVVMILSWGLVKCQSGAVCVCVCVCRLQGSKMWDLKQ